jgi:hypothetical protein
MNKIAIENGYYVVVNKNIENKKCELELGSSVSEEGLAKITVDEANGFWRYFENDDKEPSKLYEKSPNMTFEDFFLTFIGGIHAVIGIDKSLFFKRVNGELVNYYE